MCACSSSFLSHMGRDARIKLNDWLTAQSVYIFPCINCHSSEFCQLLELMTYHVTHEPSQHPSSVHVYEDYLWNVQTQQSIQARLSVERWPMGAVAHVNSTTQCRMIAYSHHIHVVDWNVQSQRHLLTKSAVLTAACCRAVVTWRPTNKLLSSHICRQKYAPSTHVSSSCFVNNHMCSKYPEKAKNNGHVLFL